MVTRILVPIDLQHGEQVDEVLRITVKIAEATGAEVCLLNVIEAAPAIVSQYLPEGYEKMASGKAESELATLVAGMGATAERVTVAVRFGTVYQEILACAEKTGTDLIVIGSHKPTAADYLLGSNASRVVRHARCSVFVVR